MGFGACPKSKSKRSKKEKWNFSFYAFFLFFARWYHLAMLATEEPLLSEQNDFGSFVRQGNALSRFYFSKGILIMDNKNLFRNKIIKVYVTPEEKKKIKENMKNSGQGNLTNYVRKMALNGRVINIDFNSLKNSLTETSQYIFELNKIGNNLNQIAHKLNQTDIVEKEDIEFLLSEFDKMQKNYVNSEKIIRREVLRIIGSE